MSVIDYLYLGLPENCNIEEFLAAAQGVIPEIQLHEHETSRSKPNWKWLTFTTNTTLHYEYLFCVERNSAAGIREIRATYPESKHLDEIVNSKKVVWSQIRIAEAKRNELKNLRWKLHEQELLVTCKVHNELLLALAKLGRAIIDRPEHERLCTSQSFGNYVRDGYRENDHIGMRSADRRRRCRM